MMTLGGVLEIPRTAKPCGISHVPGSLSQGIFNSYGSGILQVPVTFGLPENPMGLLPQKWVARLSGSENGAYAPLLPC